MYVVVRIKARERSYLIHLVVMLQTWLEILSQRFMKKYPVLFPLTNFMLVLKPGLGQWSLTWQPTR